jgi:ribonuclease P protein component
MLPSIFRLKKKRDFERVFDLGRALAGKFFILRHSSNELAITRFGCVISAKVSRRATDRNKLKRQVNEIIRLSLEKIKTGFDVVIIFKRSAPGSEYQALEKDLISLLIKGGLSLK